MIEKKVPVKINNCVNKYHLPVSIQHRLSNEIRENHLIVRTFLSKGYQTGVYVRHGSGLLLLLRVVSTVETPPPKGFIYF